MFDLDQFDLTEKANEGAEIELYDKTTGENLGVFITVAGLDSDVYRKAQMAQQNKRLKLMQNRRNKTDVTAEDLEREALELLAACTLSWRNMGKGGEELPCTKENVLSVYKRYRWIREQVDAAIADDSLFFGQK